MPRPCRRIRPKNPVSTILLAALLVLQCALVAAAVVLPNDTLAIHGYWLFGIQAISLIAYTLPKLRYVKNLFLPSFFALVYVSVNLTMGGYLVPRGYGWDKQFAETALNISSYNTIVPYMLLSNVVLLAITLLSLRRLELQYPKSYFLDGRRIGRSLPRLSVPVRLAAGFKDLAYLALFAAAASSQVFSAISIQLAIMVLHLSRPSVRLAPRRIVLYVLYLLLLVAFSFENKREIAVALFLVCFLEAYHRQLPLHLSIRSLALAVLGGVAFAGLILAASILRGYADVPVASILEAVTLIPGYVSSDFFVDGITDNLEFNYNYGAAVTAIDLVLGGRIDFQYGASLIKVFFLPVSREVVPWKPESMIQIFTQEHAPAWWADDGSIPVGLLSEMFVNFHVGGLVAYGLIVFALNALFATIDRVPIRSVVASSCIFLSITVLFFARGSGIEQWTLYYLVALPVFCIHAAVRVASQRPATGHVPRYMTDESVMDRYQTAGHRPRVGNDGPTRKELSAP